MENNRRRAGETDQIVDNIDTQHQNRRDSSPFGLDGMNYEQQREGYRIAEARNSQDGREERNRIAEARNSQDGREERTNPRSSPNDIEN